MSKKAIAITAAALAKLSLDELGVQFVTRAKSATRTFLEMGIIRSVIEENLPEGTSITAWLKEKGADDGSISNSAYATKAYRILCEGPSPALTVTEFLDKMTFNKCVTVVNVTGGSKKNVPAHVLTPDTVGQAILNETNAVDFLKCMAEHGKTPDQRAADIKAAADAKAKETTTPPAPAKAPTGDDIAAQIAATAALSAQIGAGTSAPAAKAPAAPATTPAATTPAAPAAKAGAPAPVTPTTPAAPATTTQTPAEKPKVNLDAADEPEILADLKDRLADILDDSLVLSVEGLKTLFLAVSEVQQEIGEMLDKATKVTKITAAA